MIANALRVEIERYAAGMKSSNPLFRKAADGTFSSEYMVRYLTNVRHLVWYAQRCLDRAREQALAAGDVQLANFYQHKLGEELGHETWADRDLERVTGASRAPLSPRNSASASDLVMYLEQTIDEDPALYLSYMLFSEYLVVLLGPEWLRMLEERCGFPRSSMTMIGNHIELDREHVQEALDEIDDLVGDPAKLPRMRGVLVEILGHFDRFCAEVTSLSSFASASPDAVQDVSAA